MSGPGAARRRGGESGFSLVELIVVISILGIIGVVLTEATIIGFRTTDAVANDLSRSVAVQALQSVFTGDVQSARLVSSEDPAPACATTPGVFLHLSWADQGLARDVSYSLEADAGTNSPAVTGQGDLVRWSCTAGGSPQKKLLGRFSFDANGPAPVRARCGDVDCGTTPAAPVTVTLRILAGSSQGGLGGQVPGPPPPAVDLTVRRRTA